MKITSMDIANKEFKRNIRGYSTDEVDEFLEKVSEDYEVLYKENSSIKEKLFALNEKIEHYAKMETTIQNTLLLAQNAAEQSKQTAQKEADLIIRSANESGKRILDKAHGDVLKISDDYDRVKQEFVKFRAQFRNFINTQVDMFNSLEKDFIKNYSLGNTIDESMKEKEIDLNSDINHENNMDRRNFRVSNVKEEDLKTDNLNEIKSFFAKGD